MRGAQTASVFPLARGAEITMFCPPRIRGMASFCTGVKSGKRAKKGIHVSFNRFLQSSKVNKGVTQPQKVLFSQIGVMPQEIKSLDGSFNKGPNVIPSIP